MVNDYCRYNTATYGFNCAVSLINCWIYTIIYMNVIECTHHDPTSNITIYPWPIIDHMNDERPSFNTPPISIWRTNTSYSLSNGRCFTLNIGLTFLWLVCLASLLLLVFAGKYPWRSNHDKPERLNQPMSFRTFCGLSPCFCSWTFWIISSYTKTSQVSNFDAPSAQLGDSFAARAGAARAGAAATGSFFRAGGAATAGAAGRGSGAAWDQWIDGSRHGSTECWLLHGFSHLCWDFQGRAIWPSVSVSWMFPVKLECVWRLWSLWATVRFCTSVAGVEAA